MANPSVMTLPRFVSETRNPTAEMPTRRRFRRESLVLFAVFAAVYLVCAALLTHWGVVFTDATSRVANAYFVLYSRDPHLPALGFVWNPLPSLSLLPILPLKSLFPALVTQGLAGSIQSSLCMAGTVSIISTCLRKLGLRTGPRRVLVMLFGLQPMILLYGGSGQSEPMLLLFLSAAVSALLSWTHFRQPGSLVMAGISLGLAYLARYEAVGAAASAVVFVAAVSWFSARGTRGERRRVAVNDVLLVGGPALFAVLLWAASARILVGQWFPTFSSSYGNAAQVANASRFIRESTGTGFGATSAYLSRQIFVLAPGCAVLLIVALVLAWRRRDIGMLAAPFLFGSVMAFAAAALLAGSSFGWLRFQISVIPLTVLLAGSLLAHRTPGTADTGRRTGPRTAGGSVAPRRPAKWYAVVAVGVLVAVAFPVQAVTLTDPGLNLAREEAGPLSAVLHPAKSPADDALLFPFGTERQVSSDIDAMHLPQGAVLTDSAFAFAVILDSTAPKTYVINSDLDFPAALQNPAARRIQFLLVPTEAPSDQLQARWPTILSDGGGISTLYRQWKGPRVTWNLFRLS
ncbi:ABC transporter [Nakamurella sp. PAMC28650]|uniref:ABC transporter n=1 Tax=Nakamurella sp. PAMC28650 TaxID=2762325 RepID=UPI00164E45B6|nr:ABC transporter [Nakamurella sp. PAMC28650]QNK79996.1 ABC transporter [Nakamurella sp. PAMC28650]